MLVINSQSFQLHWQIYGEKLEKNRAKLNGNLPSAVLLLELFCTFGILSTMSEVTGEKIEEKAVIIESLTLIYMLESKF